MKKILLLSVICFVVFSAKAQNPGDVNKDGSVNSADVVMVYNIIINGWSEPSDNEFTINGVSFKMIEVEGGTFQMGATSEQQNPNDDEKPVHQVTLSSYKIGETEVTQALWEAVMGKSLTQITDENNWHTFGVAPNYPMYYISWYDCQDFIARLNQMTNRNFRLPTEAEWEYAARGGNRSRGTQYSGAYALENCGWYGANCNNSVHTVATKQANELGIYDMSGNVWEWCQDWYGSYNSMNQTNPTGHKTGSKRVSRGGGWNYFAELCRSTSREGHTPNERTIYLGLRLALSE